MSISQKRVCVIGAGASGMSMLFQFKRLKEEGKEVPEFVCYEKQDNWGGLWNYSWRTGLDGNGDAVHGSMYRYLFSNGPKECLEYPDYTFEDHFGKPIPSYPPRVVLFDYLCGRWTKHNLRPWVRFSHMVRDIRYNKSTNNFTVIVKNKAEDKELPPQTFDYVVVGTGHFSAPNIPSFPGIENFPGRVMHSHDLRDSREFKDKRVLLVGSRYSAEDISMQVVKYGAKSAIISYRTAPLPFKYPADKITQRPLLLKIEDQTCHFKDGSTADVDAIILCTGYLYTFNYLSDDLRLRCEKNVLYPPDLYKSIVFLKGGNNQFMYMGMQDEYYSYTMLDSQARWICKYIIGDIKLPDHETMVKDAATWVERNKALKDPYEEIDFQTEYIEDLVKEGDYGRDLDTAKWFKTWEDHKLENILTYRDYPFASKFTGNLSPPLPCTWMEAKDDSIKWFLSGQS